MSMTLEQIFVANPITTNTTTDLMYFSKFPYTPGQDAGMTYANFSAQFTGAGLAVLLAPSTDQTITGAHKLLLSQGTLVVGAASQPVAGAQISAIGPIAGSGISASFSYNNVGNGANFIGYKSASATIGVFSAVGSAEVLANYYAYGDDGTQFTRAAAMRGLVNGTVSNGIVPGQWQFFTANTSGVLTLGMTLNASQNLILANALLPASGGTGLTSLGTGVATALGQNVNGSGAIALTTSPSFVTPALGVSSATSINFGGAALSTYSGLTAWTPVFTFLTMGDLSVSYSSQSGYYSRIGNLVTITFLLVCTPTFTTASSTFKITGLPFTSNSGSGNYAAGGMLIGAVTLPAGRTSTCLEVDPSVNYLTVYASGSAVSTVQLNATNFTTGVAVTLAGSLTYMV